VWSPYLKKDIKRIEKEQRRAAKIVKRTYYMTYEERLNSLGITSLEKRRIRADLIQAFRIIKGFDKLNMDYFFDFDNSGQWRVWAQRSPLRVEGSHMQTPVETGFLQSACDELVEQAAVMHQ